MEVILVALIAAVPATIAAIAGWRASRGNKSLLQGIDASVNSRPVGEPKLYDRVVDGHRAIVDEIAKVHVEAGVTRGMVEELGVQFHVHAQDDIAHFRTIHQEILKVTDAEESHAQTALDDRAQIATDLAAEQAAD